MGLGKIDMDPNKSIQNAMSTISFDEFWQWLIEHNGCILRAGTPTAVIFDDESVFWNLRTLDADHCLVQVVRGKSIVGEMILIKAEITYVQGQPGEQEEHLFELISETQTEHIAAYHFVVCHGYDVDEPKPGDAWIN